jgi:hypothetical protein
LKAGTPRKGVGSSNLPLSAITIHRDDRPEEGRKMNEVPAGIKLKAIQVVAKDGQTTVLIKDQNNSVFAVTPDSDSLYGEERWSFEFGVPVN